MALEFQDGLEVLRQRASCPICKRFYSSPKRLDCSHVFCLECIRRHLQIHNAVNFPPWPMCRRPITKACGKVTSLEPARAEEEIADYVKKFEVCDLCGRNKNPNIKCIDCNFLICDNCSRGHDIFKPSHTIVSISDANTIGQNVKCTCTDHGKSLNMFCIMCKRALCVLCERLTHDNCKSKWKESDVQERYSNGFLLDFVNLDEERMSLYKQKKLPKLVYLKELVSYGRLWLASEKGRQVYKRTIGDQYVYDESFEVLESQKKSYDECDVNDSITDVQILQGIFYMETYLELKSLVRTTIALTRLALLNIIMIIAFLISTATYNLTISTITVLLRSPPTPSKFPVLVRCFRVVFQYLVLLVQNLIMRILDRKTNPFLSVKVRKNLFSQRMAFLHFLFLLNFATIFIILILSLIFPQNVLVYVTCIGVFYRLLETIVNELISEGKFKQLLIYYEDLKLLFPSLFRLLVVYLPFCGIFTVFILLSGNPEAGMDSTIAV